MNDNSSKGRDLAKRNFDQGKSPAQTRKDLGDQKRRETVKPVKPKK
jgi:hypothetical protein